MWIFLPTCVWFNIASYIIITSVENPLKFVEKYRIIKCIVAFIRQLKSKGTPFDLQLNFQQLKNGS